MTTDAQSATNKLSLLNAFYPSAELNNLAEGSEESKWIESLNEFDLADCVLQATVQGNELLVRTLMERRGPIPIHFEKQAPDYTKCLLNGREVQLPGKSYLHANRPAELKSLLAMIREYDMKGLIDPGETYPLMLTWIEYEQTLNENNLSHFEGELPTLDNGILKNPELAFALADDRQSAATAQAYKPVLCWATEEMLREFAQQLAPLRPFQVVEGQGSMAEWKAKSNDPECMKFSKITVGVKPSENNTQFAPLLVDTMGPEASRMGFDDPQGRVLCETTVDFLLQFPVSDCTVENFERSVDFVNNYCPMSIISLQANEVCVRDFGHAARGFNFNCSLDLEMVKAFNPIFLLLAKEHPLRERALDMMSRDQWLGLIKKADQTFLYPQSLLAIRDTLGLDNAGMHIKIDYPGFRTLFEGGYRFADNTKFFSQEREFKRHNDKYPDADSTSLFASMTVVSMIEDIVFLSDSERVAQMLSIYVEMLSANLWPVEHHEKPDTLLEVLSSGKYMEFEDYRDPQAMTTHSYLLMQGVDACARVATTDEHWKTLAVVFSPAELTPYLSQIPGKIKGQMIEQEMGL
jgi:hypothetical protein